MTPKYINVLSTKNTTAATPIVDKNFLLVITIYPAKINEKITNHNRAADKKTDKKDAAMTMYK
jgi:hypothetical protein